MIKLLSDENFPLVSVKILEERTYDVLSILRSFSGISDREIILLANKEKRLILTFDRDFGQLIFKEGLIPENGIFYFRLQDFSASEPAYFVLDILEKSKLEVANTMIVIERNFIRQKKF